MALVDSDYRMRRAQGRVLLLLGLLLMTVSAIIVSMSGRSQIEQLDGVLGADGRCKTLLGGLGGAIENPVPGTIVVRWGGVEAPLVDMGKASAAAMACAGWQMESACIGAACQVPGTSVILRRRLDIGSAG